jgi:hypothetical protein
MSREREELWNEEESSTRCGLRHTWFQGHGMSGIKVCLFLKDLGCSYLCSLHFSLFLFSLTAYYLHSLSKWCVVSNFKLSESEWLVKPRIWFSSVLGSIPWVNSYNYDGNSYEGGRSSWEKLWVWRLWIAAVSEFDVRNSDHLLREWWNISCLGHFKTKED